MNTVETSRNGITNVIFNNICAMDKSGLQIDFVSINQPEPLYVDTISQIGGEVYVLPRTRKSIIKYWLGLQNLIRKKAYDIVHIHGNSHTTVLELIAIRLAGCGVGMVHAHTTTCDHVVAHRLLTPVFNRLCTHRVACGKAAGDFMYDKAPFFVINNGIDTQRFAFDASMRKSVRNNLGLSDEYKLIGHVGYFLAVKNQSFLVEVFQKLYQKNTKYRLLLIGDGEQREQVETKIANLSLSDFVILTGGIDNVSDYLNAMDIVVMPSLYEGLPLALIEQQANGLHCVVSDSITKEVDKTGNMDFLPLSWSAAKWADYIDHCSISSERKQQSDDAIAKIKTIGYDIQTEAEKLRKLYLSIGS